MFLLQVALALTMLVPGYQVASVPPTKSATTSAAESKLHQDSITLVELTGARKRVTDSADAAVESGRKQMAEKCSGCTPAYFDEWARRMKVRFTPQQFLDVYTELYAKYFTDQELMELIALQTDFNAGRTPAPSEALKAKLTSIGANFMGEVLGRCAQIGATLGIQVDQELAKEHPEWIMHPAPEAKQ